jgi:hypothetical protein
MDLSKLPKLSRTGEAPKVEGAADPDAGHTPPAAPRSQYAEPMIGAEVWISLVMGMVYLWLGGTFARYLLARFTGQEFHTHIDWMEGSPKAGQEVAYFELQGYSAWTDASMFLFGAAMIADGLMLLGSGGGRRGWLVWAGFALTAFALAMNVVTALLLMSTGVMPLMSLVAIAIGGYMAAYQWRMIPGRATPPR